QDSHGFLEASLTSGDGKRVLARSVTLADCLVWLRSAGLSAQMLQIRNQCCQRQRAKMCQLAFHWPMLPIQNGSEKPNCKSKPDRKRGSSNGIQDEFQIKLLSFRSNSFQQSNPVYLRFPQPHCMRRIFKLTTAFLPTRETTTCDNLVDNESMVEPFVH